MMLKVLLQQVTTFASQKLSQPSSFAKIYLSQAASVASPDSTTEKPTEAEQKKVEQNIPAETAPKGSPTGELNVSNIEY
jgi:hypothetical protein